MKFDNLIGLKLFDRWIITSIDKHEHDLDAYKFNIINTVNNTYSCTSLDIYNHDNYVIFTRTINYLTSNIAIWHYNNLSEIISVYGLKNTVAIEIETGKQIEIDFNKQTIK